MRPQAPHTTRNGFSLIELIVSVGIFALVATFAIGSLLTLTNAQRKAAALQSAFDNVRFAIEAVAKDIRTGTNYQCMNAGFTAQDTTSFPCQNFQYRNSQDTVVQVRLGVPKNVIERKIGSGGWGAITDDSVPIDQLDFFLADETSEATTRRQSFLTIVVRGTAGRSRANSESKIFLQTSVTPRKLQP